MGGPFEIATYKVASDQACSRVFVTFSWLANYKIAFAIVKRAIDATFMLMEKRRPSMLIIEKNLRTYGLALVKKPLDASIAAAPVTVDEPPSGA